MVIQLVAIIVVMRSGVIHLTCAALLNRGLSLIIYYLPVNVGLSRFVCDIRLALLGKEALR